MRNQGMFEFSPSVESLFAFFLMFSTSTYTNLCLSVCISFISCHSFILRFIHMLIHMLLCFYRFSFRLLLCCCSYVYIVLEKIFFSDGEEFHICAPFNMFIQKNTFYFNFAFLNRINSKINNILCDW